MWVIIRGRGGWRLAVQTEAVKCQWLRHTKGTRANDVSNKIWNCIISGDQFQLRALLSLPFRWSDGMSFFTTRNATYRLLLGAYRGRFQVPNLDMLNKCIESHFMCLLFKKITNNYKRHDVQHNGPPELLGNVRGLTASCSYLRGSVNRTMSV